MHCAHMKGVSCTPKPLFCASVKLRQPPTASRPCACQSVWLMPARGVGAARVSLTATSSELPETLKKTEGGRPLNCDMVTYDEIRKEEKVARSALLLLGGWHSESSFVRVALSPVNE